MEERDLYSSYKEVTGKTYFKGDKIPEGYYALVVLIFIENSNGEFLIQRRSIEKGGQWASTGGHPKKDENSYDAIISEVEEEIGLDMRKKDFSLFYTLHDEDSICDLYYLKDDIDISTLKLQTEEVQDIKWASKEEIEVINQANDFHPSHYDMYKICLNHLS